MRRRWRAKRRAALTELDSLTQSIFLDLFGDPVKNSKAWKCVEMQSAVVGKYGIKAGPVPARRSKRTTTRKPATAFTARSRSLRDVSTLETDYIGGAGSISN